MSRGAHLQSKASQVSSSSGKLGYPGSRAGKHDGAAHLRQRDLKGSADALNDGGFFGACAQIAAASAAVVRAAPRRSPTRNWFSCSPSVAIVRLGSGE